VNSAELGPAYSVDRQTDDELTLILGAGGLHVMLIRLHYDGWVDEVVNSAGVVANGTVRLDPRRPPHLP
jgi:hypothetical protein